MNELAARLSLSRRRMPIYLWERSMCAVCVRLRDHVAPPIPTDIVRHMQKAIRI